MTDGFAIRVLVAAGSSDKRREISQAIHSVGGYEVAGEALNQEELLAQAEKLSVDIILIDEELQPESGITALAELNLRSETPAILLSSNADPQLIRAAMVAGARDFYSGSINRGQLIPAIERVVAQDRRKHTLTGRKGGSSAEQNSRVVVVCGAKGGIGKSTIAVNLATAMATLGQGRVVLVDMNTQFGDTPLLLNLTPARSLSDVSQLSDELDDELINYYMTPHDSGLHLLISALTPQPIDLIQKEQVERIFKVLRRNYSMIVVDAPSFLGETLFGCLSQADRVLFVMTAEDLPTLNNSRTYVEAVSEIWGNRDRIELIINRINRQNPLTPNDIHKTLGIPIVSRIPEDTRTVRASVNEGIPFVISSPSSAPGAEVRRLASAVISRSPQSDNESGEGSRRVAVFRALLNAGRGGK